MSLYTKRLEGTHVQDINRKNGNSGELLQRVDCEHGTRYSTTLACPATPSLDSGSPPRGCPLSPGAPVDYL